jgi:hypothetical protein
MHVLECDIPNGSFEATYNMDSAHTFVAVDSEGQQKLLGAH